METGEAKHPAEYYKKYIIVRLQIEGLHNWPNCNIEEVSFLKNEHRHIFHIELKKQVNHNDRDIEIIQLKRGVIKCIDNLYGTPAIFGSLSCESIASILVDIFELDSCSVIEDGENGACVIR